jgi:hypothetical protein
MVLGLSLLFDKDADCASLLTQRRLFDRGVEVTGVEVTGVEVTGVEVTGVEVTGVEVTGVEVTGVEVTGVEVTRFEFESEELGAFSDCEDPFLDGMFGRMPGMTQVKGTCAKEGEVCAIIN